MGVIVAMLMNEVHLTPGQALYVPPRVPHAYLSGTGVELLAGSDNVLRAGLTPKHVDVPELLAVASFEPGPPCVLEPERRGAEDVYASPAPEFRLSRMEAGPIPEGGPQLILCAAGEVRLRRGDQEIGLRRGQAVFAAHEGGPISVTGSGTIFRASLPRA